MVPLPDILFEEKYEGTWEFDDWKPVAKDNAPQEVKDAIAAWIAEVDTEEDGDDIIFM